ncbi:hypothetical protein COS66_01940 [Candidatus Berkelbacteria bacterium CG06_land_8_20_14_3_00_43_10]|uniref:SpoVT-AbrB domain-containing protein n=1 Tax=Candidatus Berkelbacteria bacterium CG10_big_fil_rev_8_21_14_0_10_43_14 TaxID=1974515 RepID=A0A2M6R9F2_9BACT|nr:MAG: hypothetical protein AUK41_03595 [Candidatus Berkelbacteria bacterium CG2_30_43_20]PIS07264.1 MAG: hypothetical protein COT79_00305 [Candidatus Berkelbacteria bacterium CG10_big_fil_rev_8_21_14_0_10_43_14]PIU87251.1 MAG: hypothetical protein COS66_01940 [Candidatus Berkelbacteria bacterium CG06_land_8_20_14_3_00_43_10]
MAQSTSMRIWDKGQITIPTRFRKDLNLDEGTVVYIEQFGDALLLRPKESSIMAIQKRGEELMRAKGITVEDLIDEEN